MMEADEIGRTPWTELPIRCPDCGNHGERNGEWATWHPVPFKLVENVLRSFMFAASVDKNGVVSLRADVETDDVDWDSGTGMRLQCVQCGREFEVPENSSIDFD